jgi:hypothetical protein
VPFVNEWVPPYCYSPFVSGKQHVDDNTTRQTTYILSPIITSRCNVKQMSFGDGHHRHTMPDRRKIEIPWDVDLHNGNKEAALEAKRKFCARIDAAGRSPSPCAEKLQHDIGPGESDNRYDCFPELPNTGITPQLKRKKLRHSSKASLVEGSDEALTPTPIIDKKGKLKDVVIEKKVEDEDLYGLTPKAIIEDSMDDDGDVDATSRKSPIVEKLLAVVGTTSVLKNVITREQTFDDNGGRNPATTEDINTSDDSESSSGNGTEYTEGVTKRVRDQLVQRLASQASSRANKKTKADMEPSDVDRITKTPNNAAISHTEITLVNVQNPCRLVDSEADVVTETQNATHCTVHLVRSEPLRRASIPPSEPILALSLGVSSHAQTSGAQYKTPQSRDVDAIVVLDTNQPPSLTAPISVTQTMVESRYNRASGSVYDGLSRSFHKHQPSSRREESYPHIRNGYIIKFL